VNGSKLFGLRKVKDNVKGAGDNAVGGFSRIDALVVVVILVVGVTLGARWFAKSRMTSARVGCVNRLKNIGLAYRIFATDHDDRFPFQISTNESGTLGLDIVKQFQRLSNELSTPKILVDHERARVKLAPAGSWAELGRSNISYFVGVSAAETNPAAILAGDDGFSVNGVLAKGERVIGSKAKVEFPQKFHDRSRSAYVVLADGTAEASDAAGRRGRFGKGMETNLFLFP